jgi:integrase/recombinase XerD
MRRLLDEWRPRFRQHLLMRGLSVRTVDGYAAELVPLLGFLAERGVDRLTQVTRDDLEAYRHHLYYGEFKGKRLGLGSQARRLAAVKAFFSFLTDRQAVLLDPSAAIRRPRVPKTVPRQLISERETEKLLQAPDITTPLGIRNRAILELLYATGIRNTELRELMLGEVDLERQELFVARGKGGKSRRLPLGEEAAAWLEDYLLNARPYLANAASADLVFLSSNGCRLDRGKLSEMVRELATACGLEKPVTPHLLRHACATHMLRRGAGVRQLQVLLGHSDLSSTQRYTRIDIGDLHKTVARYHPRERGFDSEA